MSIGLVYPIFSTMIFDHTLHFLPEGTSEATRGLWLGALLAICPLAQFFSSPVIGMFSDRQGRLPILKATVLIIMLGYFFSAFGIWIENLFFLLLGRMIVGIGAGNASVVNASVADLSEHNQKEKNFGLINMANGVGLTIGPCMGGILSLWGGLDLPFIFAGGVTALNLILLLFVFKETLQKKNEDTTPHFSTLLNLAKGFQHPKLRALFMTFFIFSVGWSFYWEFIPVIWIEKYHLTISQIGNFYAYGAGFYALSCGLLIRPLIQKYRGENLLFAALVLLGLSIFPLLFEPPSCCFWYYIPLQQFFLALLFPVGISIISNSVSENEQGQVMGILQSLESFAFSTTPFIAGLCISLNHNAPILFGGTLMICAAFILFLGRKKTRHCANQGKT